MPERVSQGSDAAGGPGPQARRARSRKSPRRAPQWRPWHAREPQPSWRALRAEGRDDDRLAAIDVEALDARPRRIAQADRFGALHEGALLAPVDECEAARPAEQEI